MTCERRAELIRLFADEGNDLIECDRALSRELAAALASIGDLEVERDSEHAGRCRVAFVSGEIAAERDEWRTAFEALKKASAALVHESGKLRVEAEIGRDHLRDEITAFVTACDSVLCDPEGTPCFWGSDGDRMVYADARTKVRAVLCSVANAGGEGRKPAADKEA